MKSDKDEDENNLDLDEDQFTHTFESFEEEFEEEVIHPDPSTQRQDITNQVPRSAA